MTPPLWPDVIGRLVRREDLPDDLVEQAMSVILSGEATDAQIAGFAVALRAKGESSAELATLVRTMLQFAERVELDGDRPLLDTCGTGGDRAGTVNVSTMAALVAAAAGARVAKHGNRAASGRCGSADLLEAWGVAISLPPDAVARCIDEVGIGFCFAQAYHPAMRYVMPVRRELGVRTIFNIMGPLSNPAGAAHQTIGVSDPAMAERMAHVLAALDTTHALVFHGHDGLDELTTTGPSRVWEVRDGAVDAYELDPAELGVARAAAADLVGGEVETNRAMADAVLEGKPGPTRDVVVLAAAAALYAADVAADLTAGIAAAATAIDSGAALDVLDRWVALSQELVPA
jgi:anthranilate phosphoribosyltransferase